MAALISGRRLRTSPPRSARTLLAELGTAAEEFPNLRSLAARAGVCPGSNESAGKRRSGRARKGNAALRAALTECAHGAARTKESQFHGYHCDLARRIGCKRAIPATAHKLLRVIRAMLLEGQPYRDPGVDYEKLAVARN